MQEPNQSSAETPNTETPAAETQPESRLKTLAQLFSEEPSETTEQPEQGTEGTAAGDSPEKAKPKSLKAIAETLKLKDADLYAIEVPMANGETRTLGQLKDLVSKQDDFTVRELAFEEERQSRDADFLRAQQEFQELLGSLPRNALKPEMLEKVRQKHEATLTRERAKTLEAIPEWRDEAKRTEEISGIVEHLEGYGFPKNYLTSIYDHRTLRYIRDNFQREQRIRRALEAVQRENPGKTSKSKPTGTAPKKPTTSQTSTTSRDKLAQLFQGT